LCSALEMEFEPCALLNWSSKKPCRTVRQIWTDEGSKRVVPRKKVLLGDWTTWP